MTADKKVDTWTDATFGAFCPLFSSWGGYTTKAATWGRSDAVDAVVYIEIGAAGQKRRHRVECGGVIAVTGHKKGLFIVPLDELLFKHFTYNITSHERAVQASPFPSPPNMTTTRRRIKWKIAKVIVYQCHNCYCTSSVDDDNSFCDPPPWIIITCRHKYKSVSSALILTSRLE